MWKSGPEWAAQQAKLASDRIQNTGVFSACPSVMSARTTPLADALARAVSSAAGAGRSSTAAGRITAQAMTPRANMAKRQSCVTISQRARRHQRRAQRQTSRDKRHREASMADEPAGRGSGQRDIYGAGGKTGGGTVKGQKH